MHGYAKSLQSCLTLMQPYGPQPARLLSPWDSPGKNTGVGCYVLLQGIFPTQEYKPRSPALQVDSFPLSLWGNSSKSGEIRCLLFL